MPRDSANARNSTNAAYRAATVRKRLPGVQATASSRTRLGKRHQSILVIDGSQSPFRHNKNVPTGQVIQINISAGGVPKHPIQTAHVSRLGIDGDKHLYRLHGGPQKALMLMSAEFIDTLAAEGFSVYYGAMGENLTVAHLPCHDWRPGQRYRVGTVLIEFTEPRAPCSKLRPYGAGIEKRIRRFPGESGFYAAVLEDGIIRPGDTIQSVDPVVAYAGSRKFARSISD